MDLSWLHAHGQEVCHSCGYHLRWLWKRWSDEDLASFYASGLCKRCRTPREPKA
jgi:hypothetical protein